MARPSPHSYTHNGDTRAGERVSVNQHSLPGRFRSFGWSSDRIALTLEHTCGDRWSCRPQSGIDHEQPAVKVRFQLSSTGDGSKMANQNPREYPARHQPADRRPGMMDHIRPPCPAAAPGRGSRCRLGVASRPARHPHPRGRFLVAGTAARPPMVSVRGRLIPAQFSPASLGCQSRHNPTLRDRSQRRQARQRHILTSGIGRCPHPRLRPPDRVVRTSAGGTRRRRPGANSLRP